MHLSNDKQINRLANNLLLSGWSILRKKNHVILISPWGIKIPVATTPSDYRSYLNFRSSIRRIIKNKNISNTLALAEKA